MCKNSFFVFFVFQTLKIKDYLKRDGLWVSFWEPETFFCAITMGIEFSVVSEIKKTYPSEGAEIMTDNQKSQK